MKNIVVAVVALAAGIAVAVPAKNAAEEVVATGYPAWSGLAEKNHIAGRKLLSGSDLRQRIVIVVEFDAEKGKAQLDETGALSKYTGMGALAGHGSTSWETLESFPREAMVVYVAHNLKNREAFLKSLELKGADDTTKFPGLYSMMNSKTPIYEHLTYAGAPDNGGKLPFAYVLGHDGVEPLLAEAYSGKQSAAAVAKAVKKGKAAINEAGLSWKKYYGFVSEPKFFKADMEKSLKSGKSFDAVVSKLKKSLTAKDAEKAKEAQMLLDGIEQTKSDVIYQTLLEAREAPHVADYHVGIIKKYWPRDKKQVAEAEAKIKASKDFGPIIKAYGHLATWSDPEFMCKNVGEAKKIVAQLQQFKRSIASLKESKDTRLQNGAMVIDSMLDEAIEIVPTKVPQK